MPGALRHDRVRGGDLKGQALAQTVGRVVMIDLDAAGHGWFIDATPADDKEFPTSEPRRATRPGIERRARAIDLLTVRDARAGTCSASSTTRTRPHLM